MVEEYAILVSYAPALSGTPSILEGESFLRFATKNGGFHPRSVCCAVFRLCFPIIAFGCATKNGGFHPRSVCYGMFRFHFPFVFNRNPIPVIPFVRSGMARCEMV